MRKNMGNSVLFELCDEDTCNWKALTLDFFASPLPDLGVKLPNEKTQYGACLLYFYINKNRPVNKELATQFVSDYLDKLVRDLQAIRHLGKQRGFNIQQSGDNSLLKSGEYMFLGFEHAHTYWSFDRRNTTDLDFDFIKLKFDNKCATCGDPNSILQAGHMVPTLPMTMDNIIPQCKACNTFFKDRFEFDNRGRVKRSTLAGLKALYNENERREIKNAI